MSDANASPTLEDAIALAARWHRGQRYPSLEGEPYILHPLRVMLRVETDAARMVAVLHDVIEDTSCTLEELRGLGYPERVIAAVDRLTRRDGEAYEAYIERVADDSLARQVKLADLADNLANTRRIAAVSVTHEAQERVARYERATTRLGAAEAEAEQVEPPL